MTHFAHFKLACALILASTGAFAQSDTGPKTTTAASDSIASISTNSLFAATLYDLDNRPVSFATYRGRAMVVNFWARWCPPCRVEIPELVALQSRKTGVEVIGIAIETDSAPVRDFAYAYDINYPVLLSRAVGLDLMRTLGNSKGGVPFTVILNKQGVIVAQHTGAMNKQQLDAAVALAIR